MHVTVTGVTHTAHLSWFMVHVAYHLQADGGPRAPDNCIRDLKADWRGDTYMEVMIARLPETPAPVL